MNDKKFCFISCVNDPLYESECIRYINALTIPDGYEVQQLSVYDAKSMAAGYNEAMGATDAKYKVYLHQDVFILNKNLLGDLLKFFGGGNLEVGMIGVVGTPSMSESGVMWDGELVGMIYSSTVSLTGESFFAWPDKPYTEVDAIDGLFMATQYDIPWREDLFGAFDMYDASQSMEFKRKGYKVVVPDMGQTPWVFHDSRVLNLEHYDRWRSVFVKEYLSDQGGE